MDKVIKLAQELNQELISLPEMKEYLRLKELYHNDQELKELRENIARLKNENKEEERNNLLQIYNRHPLVNNYFMAKEEVMAILNEIQKELTDI